jgi:hypothetical protein
MAEPIDNLRYQMEDKAWEMFSCSKPEEIPIMAICSMAISLKRIADALYPNDGMKPLNIRGLMSEIVNQGRN